MWYIYNSKQIQEQNTQESEKRMKEYFTNLLAKTSKGYRILQHAFTISYIIFAFVKLTIPWQFLIFTPFVDMLMFIMYKDYLEENQVAAFNYVRVRMLLLIITLITNFTKYLNQEYKVQIPFQIICMFSIVLVALGIMFLFTDNEKKVQKIQEISPRRVLGEPTIQGNSTPNPQRCDVEICKDKETGKTIILKEKDRMLHFLCLGPTGSGKSSMIMLKMIYQDIDKLCGIILMEPKGDLAEKFYAIGIAKHKNVMYFCPTDYDCPYFNPLDGDETRVTEQIVTTFLMLTPDSKQFFKDMTENLLRHAVRVLKRLELAYMDEETGISSRPATLIRLNDLIQNKVKGREIVNEFKEVPYLTEDEKAQNIETADWFIVDYFADRSETWKHTSGVRNQVSKLIQNKYLRRVLNPENGKSDINFDEILEKGLRLSISTAEDELQELGSFLGYFLILSIQSAVFRRPGFEWTRKPCFLYIDECQTYLNSGYSNMLTKGRSFRCGSVLATQARQNIVDKAGREIGGVVDTNCRSVVLFPGIASADAKYYQDEFGTQEVMEERTSETRQKFEIGHGLKEMNYPTEAKSYSKVTKPNFSVTDLIYKPFQECTFKRMEDSTVKFAINGVISFLPKEINDELNDIVINHKKMQMRKLEEQDAQVRKLRAEANKDFQRMKGVSKKNTVEISRKSEQKTAEPDPWGESSTSTIKPEIMTEDILEEFQPITDESDNNDFEFDLSMDEDDLLDIGI